MSIKELRERAIKYIEESDKAKGITVPIYNTEEVIEELIKFWNPTEEDVEFWANRMVSMHLKEGTSGFEKMKKELIEYWEQAPYDEDPIIDSNYDDYGERKGFVANGTNRWFRKPDGWKDKVKIAKKMK